MQDKESLKDWERQLHRELDALPEMPAPSTLIPAVLRRLEAREAAPRWYHAPWWQWPRAMRVASFLVVLAVIGGLGWLNGWVGGFGFGERLIRSGAEVKEALRYTLEACEPVLGAGGSFWRQQGQMIVIGAASMLLVAYLSCLAAGTALYRLAWRRAA